MICGRTLYADEGSKTRGARWQCEPIADGAGGSICGEMVHVRGQLHASDEIQDVIRDMIKEGALLDAVDGMKEGMQQEVTPILKRVQGIEVHAQANIVKLDQRLASLVACSGKVGVGGRKNWMWNNNKKGYFSHWGLFAALPTK